MPRPPTAIALLPQSQPVRYEHLPAWALNCAVLPPRALLAAVARPGWKHIDLWLIEPEQPPRHVLAAATPRGRGHVGQARILRLSDGSFAAFWWVHNGKGNIEHMEAGVWGWHVGPDLSPLSEPFRVTDGRFVHGEAWCVAAAEGEDAAPVVSMVWRTGLQRTTGMVPRGGPTRASIATPQRLRAAAAEVHLGEEFPSAIVVGPLGVVALFVRAPRAPRGPWVLETALIG